MSTPHVPQAPAAVPRSQPAPPAAAARPAAAAPALAHDVIAKRAYDIYVRSGRAEGRSVENWLQAEKELLAERGKKP